MGKIFKVIVEYEHHLDERDASTQPIPFEYQRCNWFPSSTCYHRRETTKDRSEERTDWDLGIMTILQLILTSITWKQFWLLNLMVKILHSSKICASNFNWSRFTFDLAEYDPLANMPEGVTTSGITCVYGSGWGLKVPIISFVLSTEIKICVNGTTQVHDVSM